MVIPVKLIPYLLVLGGLIMLLSGEDIPAALLCLLVGGVWLFFKYKGKSSSSETTASPYSSASSYQRPEESPISYTPVNSAPASASYQQTVSQANAGTTGTSDAVICPNCNFQVAGGMSFCSKCGTKVR